MNGRDPDSPLSRAKAAVRLIPTPTPDPSPYNFKHPPGLIAALMSSGQHRACIESYLDPSATLGEGSIAWWYSRILQNVRIGNHVSIGGGTEIGRGTVIGDHSRIGANVFLPPNSVIGARVFIGPNVVCTDDLHPRVPSPVDPPYDARPPVIEDDASIGAAAVLLPGVRIGRGARVAAGAIVTKDVPAFTMVVGGPAREREMPEAWAGAVA